MHTAQATKAALAMLARYNTTANVLLYDACASLSDDQLRQDHGAFFGSVLGTLNHLMTGDDIWMTRFEGGTIGSTSLDALPYPVLSDLRAAREAMDDRIEWFFTSLPDGFLDQSFQYVNNEGRTFDDPALLCAFHFFNHQTHHRGQVHVLLTRIGVPAPVLDMHRVLRPDPDTPFSVDI